MNQLIHITFSILLLALTFSSCKMEDPIDFSNEIKPILNANCISCHGGVRKKGGFSLLFEEQAFSQLESGKYAISAGQPGKSELINRLTLHDPEERMPYKKDKLSKQDIQTLKQWVREGAKWGKHWAYKPVKNIQSPKVQNEWIYSELDKFIYDKINQQELIPSTEADPETLVRRLGLDLIGVPTPKHLAENYINNPNLNNYSTLVDSLLSSPMYGEKWTSMWLDLARYADTKGYERDAGRDIWRYRDWLIRAFNRDMPYRQFITEQLAGDLLPSPTEDQFIATAFHRNTMTNDEGGTDNEEYRTAAVIDRVNTTWEVFMGTTFACVQCHSHPYDPFTHREYYQFAAFFNNTRDEDTHADYPLYRHYNDKQKRELEKIEEWISRFGTASEKKEFLQFIQTLSPARNSLTTDDFVNAELTDTKWLAMRNHSYARLKNVTLEDRDKLLFRYRSFMEGGTLEVREGHPEGKIIGNFSPPKSHEKWNWKLAEIDIASRKAKSDLYFTYQNPNAINPNQTAMMFDWFYFTKRFPGSDSPGYHTIKKSFENLISIDVPTTPVMVDNPPYLARNTHVFKRGNWLDKDDEVKPGVPASLSTPLSERFENRMDLAKWIISENNPLTARTIVNRIWEQIFGRGLVETLEDMGTQGAKPTHPELLDYLSWNFMHEYKWSLKQLIKIIVTSKTYRQQSVSTPLHQEKDPQNYYLARMPRVRLSAEQIRDQALYVSGVLSDKMYGPPVMPYQPEGIWLSPYDGNKWIKNEGDDQYRRAVYTYWKRTSPYPSMISFDGVGREVCSSRRIRTNTPLQALVTLNDSVYIDLSRKLALRTWGPEKKVDHMIKNMYEIAAGKDISAERLNILLKMHIEVSSKYRDQRDLAKSICADQIVEKQEDLAALILVANTILNLDEIITKS